MKGHKPHSIEISSFFCRSTNEFIHYTCNSPCEKVLEKYGIIPIGAEFRCKNTVELLRIPFSVYRKFGFGDSPEDIQALERESLTMNLESLMSKLN